MLLNEDLKAKLADFGSSKRKSRSKMTASLRGTLGYIAPEVLLLNFTGRMYVSEKLDVYSLGNSTPNGHFSSNSVLQNLELYYMFL